MSKQSKQKTKLNQMTEEDLLLLRKRAIQLANERQSNEKKANDLFLQINLGNDEHYGIPYKYMDEILHLIPITPIPQADDIISGVIFYHGELIAVLNLSKMLNVSENMNEAMASPELIIVTVEKMQIALFVNEVIGNCHYTPDQLDHGFQNKIAIESNPITGIYNGKVAIIDLPALFIKHQLLLETDE
ncbi:MAG: chemotaxis protein CheW [Bacteroidetes bacterium]|nr:chemotaxis protein CheW [Bacteroidota bacterium]